MTEVAEAALVAIATILETVQHAKTGAITSEQALALIQPFTDTLVANRAAAMAILAQRFPVPPATGSGG